MAIKGSNSKKKTGKLNNEIIISKPILILIKPSRSFFSIDVVNGTMYGTNNIYNLQCVTYNDVTLQKITGC